MQSLLPAPVLWALNDGQSSTTHLGPSDDHPDAEDAALTKREQRSSLAPQLYRLYQWYVPLPLGSMGTLSHTGPDSAEVIGASSVRGGRHGGPSHEAPPELVRLMEYCEAGFRGKLPRAFRPKCITRITLE